MEEIIKELGVFGIISGLITLIIHNFINKYFNKKSTLFELELNNKSELFKRELEKHSQKYRSELDIHLTKASRFHEKRLETISDLYKLIVDVRINLANLTSSFTVSTSSDQKDLEQKEQRKNDAGKSYDEFRDYYDKKRIFIPEKTCELIDNLKSESFAVLSDYHFRENVYGDTYTEFSREMVKEMRERVRDTIPSILKGLESEFRKEVDVESN